MADCNESPSSTDISESQECTTAEVADDEPGPPPYSFGHQSTSEKNDSGWPAHGDDFEQEGSGYNDTEVNEHDRYHTEVNGREQYHAEVNEHDRYYAASSRLYKGSHKTYNDDPHYSSRRHERWQEPPRYPYPDKSFPRKTHPDKPYPGRTGPGKPYPGKVRPGKTYPGQAHPAQIQRLDHANSRIYFDASQLPHQDQILSLIGAEQQDSPQLNIFHVVNVQAPQIKSHYALSIYVTLCFCLPLGIVAMIFSHKVITSIAKNDYHTARRYSKTALFLNITGIIFGIVLGILAPIFLVRVLSQNK